ncbi:MAG TPA: WecB/TagA/CpsF family glycosyltransferase [Candidatus Dormibacteraeota bacterium]|jgi:N-acetylglucosaminyldiphosphoundecaprenol N-acetyl-beta-D-mannosaminyltransferase|nr:WecB/TagA/CpsF family glycosyltransferase [Candidatus Dormibacteraeota bacterium]
MGSDTWTSMRVLGIRVDCLTFKQAVELLATWGCGGPTRLVATVNPEFVMRARTDAAFAQVLESADLCLPDGSGVVWAARRTGCRTIERVTGTDLLAELARTCAARGWAMFLLGAGPGVADRAADRLRALAPGLKVETHAGSPDASGDERALTLIQEFGPRVLAVAYGAPHQEAWIARNRDRMRVPVAIGVGGALDFLAGEVSRAPAWLGSMGLEWTYRLLVQPWRVWRMRVLPQFVFDVLRQW